MYNSKTYQLNWQSYMNATAKSFNLIDQWGSQIIQYSRIVQGKMIILLNNFVKRKYSWIIAFIHSIHFNQYYSKMILLFVRCSSSEWSVVKRSFLQWHHYVRRTSIPYSKFEITYFIYFVNFTIIKHNEDPIIGYSGRLVTARYHCIKSSPMTNKN